MTNNKDEAVVKWKADEEGVSGSSEETGDVGDREGWEEATPKLP